METQKNTEKVSNAPLLVYFSNQNCSVCHALKPKIEAMITQHFPGMRFLDIDCRAEPARAAQHTVFTVPTVIVYFDNREYIRKSRNFGVVQLQSEIEKLYAMFSTA